MAPTLQLYARKSYSHSSSGGGGGNGGAGIGGGIVAAIIILILIIFTAVFIYEYRKASRLRAQNGTAIRYSKIFKKAILIALTFGLVSLCCAGCFADGDAPAVDTGNGSGAGAGAGAPQMMDGGGFVQQPPMPTYQPQADWQPMQSAAQDGVQG